MDILVYLETFLKYFFLIVRLANYKPEKLNLYKEKLSSFFYRKNRTAANVWAQKKVLCSGNAWAVKANNLLFTINTNKSIKKKP